MQPLGNCEYITEKTVEIKPEMTFFMEAGGIRAGSFPFPPWEETDVIKLKRAYEEPSHDDGFRVLVERLWPRGLSKERAKVDLWLKDVAPSGELRTWYSHDVEKWKEFKARYRKELVQNKEPVALLRKKAKEGPLTFVYAARDEQHNSAVVLKEFLEKK